MQYVEYDEWQCNIMNFRAYLRSEKICIDQYWEKIIAYWVEFEQVQALLNKFGLFQIQFGGLGGWTTPGKVRNFFPHLSLEAVFPALELTQSCYIIMNTFFLENWQLIMIWVPLSLSLFLSLLQTSCGWKTILII